MTRSFPLKAAFWMMGAVISFSAMAVAGREMSHELDTFEIMLYRSLIGIIIVVGVGFHFNLLAQITTGRMGLHLLRNASHFLGQNLWFYAVTIIPFAQLFAFEFSVPLWVAILAPIFLAEKLTLVRILSATIGFVGILIVARPDAAGLNPGIIAAALCAIGFAGAVITTKLLSRTETTFCILFWLTVTQSVLGLVFAGFDGRIAVPSMQATPLVLVIACTGLFAHYCITTALKLAPAVIVAPMDFARLPLIAIIGMVFYNEQPDIWIWLGAGLVFAANLWNILAENANNKRLQAEIIS